MADAARRHIANQPQQPGVRAGNDLADRTSPMLHRSRGTGPVEELVSSAERDSVRIVAAAKTEIQQTLLKSQQELHLLATQTQAMIDLLQARELDQRVAGRSQSALPEMPSSARHVLARMMHESRAELATLASQPVSLALPQLDIRERFVVPETPQKQKKKLLARLSRRLRGRRQLSAALAAAAILMLTFVGVWWGLRPADGQASNEHAVATAGGAPPPMEVELEARRPVWIRIGVDGQTDAGRLFRAGEKQRITAGQEVSIRAGDAGAVLLSVNGGRPAALGRDGQVMTRRVRPEASAVTSSPGQTGRSLTEGAHKAPATPGGRIDGGNQPIASDAQPPAVRPQPEVRPQPAGRPAPSETSGAVAGNAPSPIRSELTGAAARWLEAYAAGDREHLAAVALPTVTISDERAPNERLSAGLTGIERTFDEASVQVFGSDALLTAKVIERTANGAAGPAGESVSFISQLWTRREGAWKLAEVRIVSAAALDRAFRR